MKKLPCLVAVATFLIFGLQAQNSHSWFKTTTKKQTQPEMIFSDKVFSKTNTATPLPLPFSEDFRNESSLTKWTIVDGDGDGWAWRYEEDHGNNGPGSAIVYSFATHATNDYLITPPLILNETGNHFVSFHAYPGGFASLRVLYGTSPNPNEMQLLVDYPNIIVDDYPMEWFFYMHSFNVTTPGHYYFAFNYYQASGVGYGNMVIDDILINKGAFAGVPDIEVIRGLAPVSACGMTNQETLGVEFRNKGTSVIETFTLTYQIGSGTPVSQTFNQTVGFNENVRVYFNQKANFSNLGEYRIKFTASTPGEENTHDNEAEITLRHFSPITELPFVSDFRVASNILDWNPTLFDGWMLNDYYECYYAVDDSVPLVSRCVTLQPGIYRFSYHYAAGVNFLGTVLYDDFYVAFGKSGTDPLTWEPVKKYISHYTNDKVVEDGAFVNITESGDYVFAFVSVSSVNFAVFSTSIANLEEDDFKIISITPPASFARTTPVYHATGEKTFSVALENRGSTANKTGNIKLSHNSKELASADFAFTQTGEIINVNLTPNFTSLSAKPLVLEFKASVTGGATDVMETTILISDSTFAWDRLDDGHWHNASLREEPGAQGLIYELYKKDVLTSITVGLLEAPFPFLGDIGLAVYEVDDNLKLGKMFFEIELPRTDGCDEHGIVFNVPNIELTPGKYYFEIRQLDDMPIAVVIDESSGYFYDNSNNTGVLKPIHGFGYIHLRPNFGNPSHTLNISAHKPAESQFILYPNPVSGILNVKLEDTTIDRVTIINNVGQVVHTKSNVNNATYRYYTTGLSSGMYFISVFTQTGIISSKFVVK
jgi:hypothetical protein